MISQSSSPALPPPRSGSTISRSFVSLSSVANTRGKSSQSSGQRNQRPCAHGWTLLSGNTEAPLCVCAPSSSLRKVLEAVPRWALEAAGPEALVLETTAGLRRASAGPEAGCPRGRTLELVCPAGRRMAILLRPSRTQQRTTATRGVISAPARPHPLGPRGAPGVRCGVFDLSRVVVVIITWVLLLYLLF